MRIPACGCCLAEAATVQAKHRQLAGWVLCASVAVAFPRNTDITTATATAATTTTSLGMLADIAACLGHERHEAAGLGLPVLYFGSLCNGTPGAAMSLCCVLHSCLHTAVVHSIPILSRSRSRLCQVPTDRGGCSEVGCLWRLWPHPSGGWLGQYFRALHSTTRGIHLLTARNVLLKGALRSAGRSPGVFVRPALSK